MDLSGFLSGLESREQPIQGPANLVLICPQITHWTGERRHPHRSHFRQRDDERLAFHGHGDFDRCRALVVYERGHENRIQHNVVGLDGHDEGRETSRGLGRFSENVELRRLPASQVFTEKAALGDPRIVKRNSPGVLQRPTRGPSLGRLRIGELAQVARHHAERRSTPRGGQGDA